MDQQSDAPSHRSALGDQLRVLRRRWRLVALVTVLAVAASIAYSLTRVPEYRSTADVLLSPTVFDVQRGGAEMTPDEIATQVRIATSQPVAELVRDDLRLVAPPALDDLVTVEALGSSRVLRVTSRLSDPDEAAELTRSVATSYLTYRQTNTQQTLSQVTGALAERQQRLETRLAQLDRALAQPRNSRGDLEVERRDVVSQLSQITVQLANLDISVAGGAGGELLDDPEENTAQLAPRPLLNGLLALMIGLLLGVALALARDRFDPVAHDEESLVPSLGPAPVLARVPRWKVGKGEDSLITISRPESQSSQAFQELVARIRFLVGTMPETDGRGAVVMCTSAAADEGKTDVAANLAVAAARVGLSVVLVDADMRRGSGEPMPGVRPSAPGLSDVLVKGRRVESFLVDGPMEELCILPAGVVPSNPTELITSSRMRPVIATLAGRADLVIVDAPSANYADSLEMAGLADVTILVTRLGRSRLPDVHAAAERLHDLGADLGAVVIGGTAKGRVRPSSGRGADTSGSSHWNDQPPSRGLQLGQAPESQPKGLEVRQSRLG